MNIKRFFAGSCALLLCTALCSCGEPIQSAEGDPLFRVTEPAPAGASGTTGTLVIETVNSRRTVTTATTVLTTKRYRKDELTSTSFTKKEIIQAAKLPETYLSYGYLDVDALSVSYGDYTVYRDNGTYTLPEGYDLHYVTEIEVNNVPHGKTIVLSGTAFVKVLEDVPDYPGVQTVKLETKSDFVLTKYVN